MAIAQKAVAPAKPASTSLIDSRSLVLKHEANELVFAVVGHVGSGTSTVAGMLAAILAAPSAGSYQVKSISARAQIEAWAKTNHQQVPHTKPKDIATTLAYQDLGDAMRQLTKDNSAVARYLIASVREARANFLGVKDLKDGDPVKPDGKPRAYILESLRHPEEVQLLRHLYQEAFILIGVVCDPEKRVLRLTTKYENAGRAAALDLMKRDAKGTEKHGQRVTDTFHLSDFFIDNSIDRERDNGRGNPDWNISEHLSRLVKIVSRKEVIPPNTAETAMHHAFSASLKSACLSRQVGAALVDSTGDVIATGTNEVPKVGGGIYGQEVDGSVDDHRCAFRQTGEQAFCSSTRQQNELVNKLIEEIPELHDAPGERRVALQIEIRDNGIGDIIEFSRAVHAEMDALLSAARTGTSTVGTRLYVTTYPCHYCARHIVSSGVDMVQYIEPYPKSLATTLHPDSITSDSVGWQPPSEGGDKVLFQPFVGVAPRMYRRAFIKDRELKDRHTGLMTIKDPEWGAPWHLRSAAYVELEASMTRIEAASE